MRLHIHHATRYAYSDAAAYSIQHLRLTPRSDLSQHVINWRLSTTPGHPRQQRDAHGNTVHTLSLTDPHAEITLIVDGEVETRDEPTLLPRGDGLSPLAYLADSPLATPDEAITTFALDNFPPGPRRQALMTLMLAMTERVQYKTGSTEADHTAAESFARGEGVCQDLAHIFVAACRSLGVPARYVSGYLFTDGEHAASHAWADAWLEDENGWLSCDVTHQRFADGHLCRLAVGRDYLDAGPVRGMRRGGSGESMSVKVVVSDARDLARSAQNGAQQ